MAAALVYPVFEFGLSGLGAFCGVFTTEEKAYEGACIAANAVVLFKDGVIFTAEMMKPFFETQQTNLVLQGENNNEVIIFFSPADCTFITQDFTNI